MAVVRFVIDNQDIGSITEIGKYTAHKRFRAFGAFFNHLRTSIWVDRRKGVPVGDDDFCLQQFLPHHRIHHVKNLVKIVFLFRKQNLQAVADGKTRSDD